MASAFQITELPPLTRRKEIVELYASLANRTDSEVLGLPNSATPAQVKAAFVSLAERFHPDTFGAGEDDLRDQLQLILARVTEAYQNLGGPSSESTRRAPRGPAPADLDAEARQERVEEALRAADDLVEQGRAQEAVSVLHEVLTQACERRRRRIQLALARAYALEARWRRNALAVLRELVEQDPADAEALAALGTLYRRGGLLSRAEAEFVRALSLDPGLAEARDGLRSVRAARFARPAASQPGPVKRRGLIARLLSRAPERSRA